MEESDNVEGLLSDIDVSKLEWSYRVVLSMRGAYRNILLKNGVIGFTCMIEHTRLLSMLITICSAVLCSSLHQTTSTGAAASRLKDAPADQVTGVSYKVRHWLVLPQASRIVHTRTDCISKEV